MKCRTLNATVFWAGMLMVICSSCINVPDDDDLKKPKLIARVGTQVLICPPEMIETGSVIRIYDEISDGTVGVQFTFVDPDLQMGFLINNFFAKNPRSNTAIITDTDDAVDSEILNWSVGQLNTNLNLGLNSKYYQSHSTKRGEFVITSIDETNKIMSGYFEFTAYEVTNPLTGEVKLIQRGGSYNISGEFENIPLSDGYVDFFKSTSGSGNNGGNNGGAPTGGNGNTTSVTFKNNSYTAMNITFSGTSKIATPGGTVIFSGVANSSGYGEAITSGKTSDGAQVGLELKWTLDYTYPSTGNTMVNINVPGEYFFLYVTNNSSSSIEKLYVNYGLQSQTQDNIALPSNGTKYSIGYYKAYTNSNVRLESGNKYWYWNTLKLPFTENQLISLSATN